MNIPFIKIQNVGNDYIYINKESLSRRRISKPRLAEKICDRHYGVGSDGIFIVNDIAPNSAFVEMFNSDGSSMEFCGNGIRGAALYLRYKNKSRAKSIFVNTTQDEYEINVLKGSSSDQNARLKIGNPSFDSAVIGLPDKIKNSLGISLNEEAASRIAYCVAMPNPHAVIFVEDFDFDWYKEGSAIEHDALFRNRINVMFTRVDSRAKLTVMPWERGAGATLSCGSGAGAAAVISGLLEYTKGQVSVFMPGGVLKTRWEISENAVYQEGHSGIVCAGLFRI